MDKGVYFQLIEIGTDYEKVKSGNWWKPNERTKLTEQCLLWQRLIMYASLEDEGKNCAKVAFEDVEEISKKHEIPCYQVAIALKEKLVGEAGQPSPAKAKAPVTVQKPERDTEKPPESPVRKKTKMIMDDNGQFIEVEEEIPLEDAQSQTTQASASAENTLSSEPESETGSEPESNSESVTEPEPVVQVSVKKANDPEYEKTIEMMTLALGQIQRFINKWNGKQEACFAVKKLHNYAKMMHGKDMFADEEKNS